MRWGRFSKALATAGDRGMIRTEWPVSLQTALSDLTRLTTIRPELAPAGQTLASILEILFAAPSPPLVSMAAGNEEGVVVTSIEACRHSWQQGQPVIDALVDAIDFSKLVPRVLAICAAIGTDGAPAGLCLTAVTTCPAERIVDWFRLVLNSDGDEFEKSVSSCDRRLDAAQIASVLRLALLPALADWSLAACAQLNENEWPYGVCPVCGSPPALAESRGLEQQRHPRCDRCAADWLWSHFQCAYCRTTDHRALRYQSVEGEQDRRRLVICDRCGGRLKVVSTIGTLSTPGLLVAQLDLIDLDLVADSSLRPPS